MSDETKRVVWMSERDVAHCENGGGGLFEVSSDKWHRPEHNVALVRLDSIAELIEAVHQYEREHTNPAKDYLLRARRREEMFKALSRIGGQS